MSEKRKKKTKFTVSKKRVFAFAVCIFVLAFTLPFYAFFESLLNGENSNYSGGAAQELCVSFVDVKQGDAIFIKLPNGETMLIDSGDDRFSTSKQSFESFMKKEFKNKTKQLDYVVLTHNDRDHSGNMKFVFDYFEVKNFYFPTNCVGEISFALNEENCNFFIASRGMKIATKTQDVDISILSPNGDYNNDNDYSVVLVLEYLQKRFCFTGDATEKVEKEIELIVGKCDVLKVGHHGSSTSSLASFLNAVSPKIAVISVGAKNSYGHPTQKTLNALSSLSEPPLVLRTDKNGTIKLFVSQKTINFSLGIGIWLEGGSSTISWFVVCTALAGVVFIACFVHTKKGA